MSFKTKKRYCGTCGAMMGFRQSLIAYNEETGEPQYQFIYRCPNARFWNFGHVSVTISGN